MSLGCLMLFEYQTKIQLHALALLLKGTHLSESVKTKPNTYFPSTEIIPDLPEISFYCIPGFYKLIFDPSDSLLYSR